MGGEDHRNAVGHLAHFLDEHRAHRLQPVDHIFVVDDLVPDIDRGAVALERELDDADGALHPGAEAARRGDDQVKGAGRVLHAGHVSHRLPAEKGLPMSLAHDHVPFRRAAALLALLLAGCARDGQIADGGVYVTRSGCPQVAIPAATGDITLFDPRPASRDAARSTWWRPSPTSASPAPRTAQKCGQHRDLRRGRDPPRRGRRAAGGAAFFAVAVQGGTNIVAKKVGAVALNFPAGSLRAQTNSQATVRVSRSAVALPAEVQRELTRERRPATPTRRSIR
jgi:hypothetical protein